MPKRVKVRPTKRNNQKFANTANRTQKINLKTTTSRGGIRL